GPKLREHRGVGLPGVIVVFDQKDSHACNPSNARLPRGGDFRSLSGSNGQLHSKGGSLALARTLGVHAATVSLDEMSDNRESQAETSMGSRHRGVGLDKPVEEQGQHFGANTHAGIGNGELCLVALTLETYRDAATVGRELDRVGE